MNADEVMVSICCITYNHGKFIAQAINGFLMQETNFICEILIGDDCSTDSTRETVQAFVEQYPDRIKLVPSVKNVGAHQNLINTVALAKGKYIALCEGDDYWTDPLKLQKQVDFLESNEDYVICCHYTRVIDEQNKTLYVHPQPVALQHTYFDLLAGKQEETKTATVLYRNNWQVNHIYQQPWFFNCYAGDKIFKLSATQHTGKKIHVIPEVMSCYRNHTGGIWSMIDAKARMAMVISDFNLIISHFTYPAMQKKKLLLLYLRRYLLFELRNRELRKVYNTIKYLF
jgi:glycosyltransferase involved in cell wall biosynthesis